MNDYKLLKIQNVLLFTFHESSFLELINRRHQSSSFLLQLLNLIQEVGTDNQLSRKLRANYLLSRLDQALQHQVDRDLHCITLKIKLLINFRVSQPTRCDLEKAKTSQTFALFLQNLNMQGRTVKLS